MRKYYIGNIYPISVCAWYCLKSQNRALYVLYISLSTVATDTYVWTHWATRCVRYTAVTGPKFGGNYLDAFHVSGTRCHFHTMFNQCSHYPSSYAGWSPCDHGRTSSPSLWNVMSYCVAGSRHSDVGTQSANRCCPRRMLFITERAQRYSLVSNRLDPPACFLRKYWKIFFFKKSRRLKFEFEWPLAKGRKSKHPGSAHEFQVYYDLPFDSVYCLQS